MKEPTETEEYLFKVLVLGDIGTGKTSIVKRYVHNFFSQQYRATIGVDFALKVLSWENDEVIRLQLWDIAGQERFGNMTRVYYKEASAAFVVFDVSRPTTFDGVTKWKADLDAKVQLADGKPIPTVLLANKCDLEKVGPACNHAELDAFCTRNGFVGWFETSAKEGAGVTEAANYLIQNILAIRQQGRYETPLSQRDSSVKKLGDFRVVNGVATKDSGRLKCCH